MIHWLQANLIYDNGVKVSAKKMEFLDTISSEPTADRLFINTFFFIVFSEKYLRKQIKKGLNRTEVLNKMRDSNRHKVMKGEFIDTDFKISFWSSFLWNYK